MKRPSTQDIIDRLYNIASDIYGITHLDVDDEINEDGFQDFRIRLATAQMDYPDIIICRKATEQMTDHDIEQEIRGEMKAWEQRACNAQSPLSKLGNRFSNGAVSVD